MTQSGMTTSGQINLTRLKHDEAERQRGADHTNPSASIISSASNFRIAGPNFGQLSLAEIEVFVLLVDWRVDRRVFKELPGVILPCMRTTRHALVARLFIIWYQDSRIDVFLAALRALGPIGERTSTRSLVRASRREKPGIRAMTIFGPKVW